MPLDFTAFLRGRGPKSRYPAFDAAMGGAPQEAPQEEPFDITKPVLGGFRGPAPMQEQVYPGGVKQGGETVAAPLPPPPEDAMAEFQKLGSPPRRRDVQRGQQSKYAIIPQLLSGLGDVFAAKAGQRGNYLDKNIALTEGMRDQDFRDRLMQSDRSYADDMAGYQHGLQGVNFGHQLAREGVGDKARSDEFGFRKERAGVQDKYQAAALALQQNADRRAQAESDAMLKMGAGGSDADIGRAYDLQLGLGTPADQAQKGILADQSIPLKERLRRVDLLKVAETRKESGENKLRAGAYLFGQPDFTLRDWGDLTKRFRASQDLEERRDLLNQMNKINPSVPFIGSRYSQLPDDIAAWAKLNW
jgi:hypothetical protein